MKAPLLTAAFALPVLLGACVSSPSSDDPLSPHFRESHRVEPEPVLTVPATLGKDTFAVDMFRAVVAERRGNVVFSPASLENMLDILKKGARGKTLAALAKTPVGQAGVRSAMQVESSDALFVDTGLPLKPVDIPDVQRVSFSAPAAAAKSVNTWCSGKTHGLIPSILSPADLSPNTRMVAVNAVYLNERWLRPFSTADTDRNGRFHAADGRTVTVPMMHQLREFHYAEGADWQAVALFYATEGRAGEPGCFIGILPKGDARRFASTLTPQKYNAIRKALAGTPLEETAVSLPKMEVRTESFCLVNALKRNGLSILFREGADFSGFADEPMMVDSVLQRCYVKVDEVKTEAAAVTAATVDCYSIQVPGQPHIITFDRPFIWAIDDLTTGSAPFFMGLYEQP